MNQKAYRYRFYPTQEQEQLLRRTLGCVRLAAVMLLINCRLMFGSGIVHNVERTMTETLMPHKIFSPQGLR
jgi:transposase